MADFEDEDFGAVVIVERNIAAMSELDNPFPIFWQQFGHWASDLGVIFQYLEVALYGSYGTICGALALRGKKCV